MTYKKIFSALVLSVLFGGALAPLCVVQAGNPAGLDEDFDSTKTSIEINSFKGFNVGEVANDPRIIIKRIINVVMGFLGMLAILIILFAGFKWMTAGGNKEQLDSAHKLLINGIIGLIIIFSAWTVAWFVVNSIKVNVGA